jgi:hypothetical protein
LRARTARQEGTARTARQGPGARRASAVCQVSAARRATLEFRERKARLVLVGRRANRAVTDVTVPLDLRVRWAPAARRGILGCKGRRVRKAPAARRGILVLPGKTARLGPEVSAVNAAFLVPKESAVRRETPDVTARMAPQVPAASPVHKASAARRASPVHKASAARRANPARRASPVRKGPQVPKGCKAFRGLLVHKASAERRESLAVTARTGCPVLLEFLVRQETRDRRARRVSAVSVVRRVNEVFRALEERRENEVIPDHKERSAPRGLTVPEVLWASRDPPGSVETSARQVLLVRRVPRARRGTPDHRVPWGSKVR